MSGPTNPVRTASLGLPDGLAFFNLVVLKLDEVDTWLILVDLPELERKNTCVDAEVAREVQVSQAIAPADAVLTKEDVAVVRCDVDAHEKQGEAVKKK